MPGLAWRNVRQRRPVGCPIGDRGGNELSPVITAQYYWSAALDDEFFQVVNGAICGDGTFDQSADAFAGVFIHDRADLECFALLTNIELKIHGPRLLGASVSGA